MDKCETLLVYNLTNPPNLTCITHGTQAAARGMIDRKRMRPQMEELAQRRAELAVRCAEAREEMVAQWDEANAVTDDETRLKAMEATIESVASLQVCQRPSLIENCAGF